MLKSFKVPFRAKNIYLGSKYFLMVKAFQTHHPLRVELYF